MKQALFFYILLKLNGNTASHLWNNRGIVDLWTPISFSLESKETVLLQCINGTQTNPVTGVAAANGCYGTSFPNTYSRSFGVSLSFFVFETYRINEILHESCLARLPSTSSGSLQMITDTACTLKYERHVGTKKTSSIQGHIKCSRTFLHLAKNANL